MADSPKCKGNVPDNDDHMAVRITAVFVVLITSAVFTLFPIVTKRISRIRIPPNFYDFAKYFGSGVIIATAFVHLLAPAHDELSQECLAAGFQVYPMAYAFALIAMNIMFFSEFLAYRLGSQILERRGLGRIADGHTCGPPDVELLNGEGPLEESAMDARSEGEQTTRPPGFSDEEARGDETRAEEPCQQKFSAENVHNTDAGTGLVCGVPNDQQYTSAKEDDVEYNATGDEDLILQKRTSNTAEVIGVFVLELGIVFHSVIIGITLATTQWESGDESFYVLYPAIVFHQVFEGLGLGARLAFMPLVYSTWFLCMLGMVYALCTPVGMAIGLGIRNTYSPDTPTFYYVSGIFDSFSAGILIYSGLVELMAHDFIFNKDMHTRPMWKALLNMFELWAGIATMGVIGRWA